MKMEKHFHIKINAHFGYDKTQRVEKLIVIQEQNDCYIVIIETNSSRLMRHSRSRRDKERQQQQRRRHRNLSAAGDGK